MDPNSLQHLAGLAYVQKFQAQVPFSEYDNLTPDEPIWALQFAKRWLKVLMNRFTPDSLKPLHTFPRRASNALPGEVQPSQVL
jgi:hypothetical protein